MDRFRDRREAMRRAILDADATTPRDERRAAFDGKGNDATGAYLATVAQHAYRVTDEDVAAVRAAGRDDAAIFELTVAAAVGQATRQIEAALAALHEASAPAAAPAQEAS